MSGVTIQLFKASNAANLVSSQTTGANGQYLFTGLQPGDYLLKEVAPAGYSANGANPVSQLDPASAVGNDTIKVSVVDPSKVFVNYGGIASGSYSVVNAVVKGDAQVNSVGPQADTLGTSAGATDLNAGFHTFCVNDQQSLSFHGGESYQVAPRPITDLNNGGGSTVSTDHAGRIAYLFNHYGNSSLTNVQGAGLQLAIWELLYDGGDTADFNSGNFQVPSLYQSVQRRDADAGAGAGADYFNESAGKSETAVFLDATPYTVLAAGYSERAGDRGAELLGPQVGHLVVPVRPDQRPLRDQRLSHRHQPGRQRPRGGQGRGRFHRPVRRDRHRLTRQLQRRLDVQPAEPDGFGLPDPDLRAGLSFPDRDRAEGVFPGRFRLRRRDHQVQPERGDHLPRRKPLHGRRPRRTGGLPAPGRRDRAGVRQPRRFGV